MGQLLYGSSSDALDLDDRTLAHVEIVILAKLRRNESFALSLNDAAGGRTTIWVSPSSLLRFRFDQGRHEIDREWLERLIEGANAAAGMQLGTEPPA